jgi:hypothetical protein
MVNAAYVLGGVIGFLLFTEGVWLVSSRRTPASAAVVTLALSFPFALSGLVPWYCVQANRSVGAWARVFLVCSTVLLVVGFVGFIALFGVIHLMARKPPRDASQKSGSGE